MSAKRMIAAAATRFQEAWDREVGLSADGAPLVELELSELHEAALGLIWATGTTTIQEALDVLSEYET